MSSDIVCNNFNLLYKNTYFKYIENSKTNIRSSKRKSPKKSPKLLQNQSDKIKSKDQNIKNTTNISVREDNKYSKNDDSSRFLKRRTWNGNQNIDTSPRIISLERKRSFKKTFLDYNSKKLETPYDKYIQKFENNEITGVENNEKMPDVVISSIKSSYNKKINDLENCSVKDKITFFNEIAKLQISSNTIAATKNKVRRSLHHVPSFKITKTSNYRNFHTINNTSKYEDSKMSKTRNLEGNREELHLQNEYVQSNVKKFERSVTKNDEKITSPTSIRNLTCPKDLPKTSNSVKSRIAEFELFFQRTNVKVTKI